VEAPATARRGLGAVLKVASTRNFGDGSKSC
jgi:hypothetical protein